MVRFALCDIIVYVERCGCELVPRPVLHGRMGAGPSASVCPVILEEYTIVKFWENLTNDSVLIDFRHFFPQLSCRIRKILNRSVKHS
jgi:hypothetical protein